MEGVFEAGASKKRKRCTDLAEWLRENETLVQRLKNDLHEGTMVDVRSYSNVRIWMNDVLTRTIPVVPDLEHMQECMAAVYEWVSSCDSVSARPLCDPALVGVSHDHFTCAAISELARADIACSGNITPFVVALCILHPYLQEELQQNCNSVLQPILDIQQRMRTVLQCYETCRNVSLCLVYGNDDTKQVTHVIFVAWEKLMMLTYKSRCACSGKICSHCVTAWNHCKMV